MCLGPGLAWSRSQRPARHRSDLLAPWSRPAWPSAHGTPPRPQHPGVSACLRSHSAWSTAGPPFPLGCPGAGGRGAGPSRDNTEPRAAPWSGGVPRGSSVQWDMPCPHSLRGGAPGLLEEKRGELSLRGRPLQRGARRLGLKEKGGPGFRLSPGPAEGTLVRREGPGRPGLAGRRGRGQRALPLSSARSIYSQ